ncbi:hypothetical protein [Streptomonospora alba]|uniref:hypothetical protein n=1 Tax=Streptomonospora alba TaxID=183763 RepID=UPI00069AAF33|nr:hypothetical protein [Streptomonospora alba]
MIDTGLMTTGLVVILGGIGLILLGGAAYIAYQALENRLDERAGIPTPHEAPRPADAPSASSEGTDREAGERRREHQPA